MPTFEELFLKYASAMDTLESIRAEIPQLADAEKQVEEIKKQIQDKAKSENLTGSAFGWQVTLSERESWDTKKLPGFAVAHPELNALKSITVVATVKRMK